MRNELLTPGQTGSGCSSDWNCAGGGRQTSRDDMRNVITSYSKHYIVNIQDCNLNNSLHTDIKNKT